MSDTNTGGPAFPQFVISNFGAHVEGGMTLRDYFAAKVMQGLMDAAMPMPEIAGAAYEMADAMLSARGTMKARNYDE
jgi:hypothetical protein